MVAGIFDRLAEGFRPGRVGEVTTYYFSVDQVKRTVTLAPDFCRVEEGKTLENADCVCKILPELFLRIWNDGYQPGARDFFSGAVKSNDPQKLKSFLQVFGK